MASDLLQQFESIAKEHNGITARIDEAIATIPEAMAECARQLTEQGKELPSFGKSYELYRQKYEALENAPEAPLGFSAFVDKPPMPSDKNFASQMPVVEASNEPIYEDSLVEDIEEWTAYVTQKLQDKDDIQLVCQPTEVLTAQFRADLETITDRQIVLLFDAFEHTGEILERWLLEILAGKHGRLPPNCIWVIAGLNQLDSVVWSGYEPVELQLIPFTPEEATKFLQNSGVSVLNEISIILEGSGCLPLLLAVLTKNAHNHPALMGDTNEMMRSFLQSALNQR